MNLINSRRVRFIYSFIVVLLIGLMAPVVAAQQQRLAKADTSVTAYRPVGELRLWTFTHKAKDMGRLISKIEEIDEIEGREAVVIRDSLYIDYSRLGSDQVVEIRGRHYVAQDGWYLGDDLILGPDSLSEELHWRVEDDDGMKTVEGYYTRGGNEIEREVEVLHDIFAWDPLLVDQLEIWLAMQDIEVGKVLSDTIYEPQSMLINPISGRVAAYQWEELYKGRFDSVFVIGLSQPQPYTLYFTPDKRLLRVDFDDRDIRVYLDYIGKPPSASATKAPVKSSGLGDKLPRYGLQVIVGLLAIAFLAYSGFKEVDSWIGAVSGIVACLIVVYLIIPMQTSMASGMPQPGSDDSSIYLWWLLPSIVFAIGQEGLKAGAIFLILKVRDPRPIVFVAVGAFVGAGLGVAEAIFQTNASFSGSVMDWVFFQQAFNILVHVTLGALMGYAFIGGPRKLAVFACWAVLVNLLIHYVPIFTIQGFIDAEVSYMVTAVVALILLFVAVVLFKRSDIAKAAQGKGLSA